MHTLIFAGGKRKSNKGIGPPEVTANFIVNHPLCYEKRVGETSTFT